MADESGIGSREAVALELTKIILKAEDTGGNHMEVYAKDNVLSTYADALHVTQSRGWPRR